MDVTGSPRFVEFTESMVESLSKGPKQVGGAFICGKFFKNDYVDTDDTGLGRQPPMRTHIRNIKETSKNRPTNCPSVPVTLCT